MADGLFFIALIPPEEIQAEVRALQQYASREFASSRALRAPAHITLFPPFYFPEEKSNFLTGMLEVFASKRHEFPVSLKNFSAFAPRVIFVAVEENAVLNQVQVDLEDYLEGHLGIALTDKQPFHPHMTVAFKDLRKDRFGAAWAYFSALHYARIFQAEGLFLLQHKQGRWAPLCGFKFSQD